MIRSSLKQFGVIHKETPTQPQAQSITIDPESPQVVDLSEGEISDSEQEGPDSGTPELDQLMLTEEELFDYDSFALASPSLNRAPLWKFAKETPSGSSTQPQAQTITIQTQSVTSTPAKPSGSKTQTQAPAQAQPQVLTLA